MLLVTPDPVINSHREVPSKRTAEISSKILNLIAPPLIPGSHQVGRKILCDDEDFLGSDLSDCEYDIDSSDDNC